MLKVRAYRHTLTRVSTRQIEAVGEGIRASGDDFAFADRLSEDADVALTVSGPKFPGSRLCAARQEICRRFNGRMLVSESPFFRQGAQPHDGKDPYFRLSVGGFMRDDGKFHPDGFVADDSRWKKISQEQGLTIRPWNADSVTGHILICMQKPSDASLRGLDVAKWTIETARKIRESTDCQIILRPHPLDRERMTGIEVRFEVAELGNFHWSFRKKLEQDLAKACAVVTYTSLSAIESVMAGVPTFCLSRANHAWNVSLGDDLSMLALSRGALNETPDRQAWVNSLAWGQWKLSELKEGTPWRRLKRLMI